MSLSLRLLMYFHRYFNVGTPSFVYVLPLVSRRTHFLASSLPSLSHKLECDTSCKFAQVLRVAQSFVKNMSYNKNSHLSIYLIKQRETWLWTQNVSICRHSRVFSLCVCTLGSVPLAIAMLVSCLRESVSLALSTVFYIVHWHICFLVQ